MAELVSHNIEHSADISEQFIANEAMLEPSTRRDYLSRLESSDFIDLTEQIASLIRTGDGSARQHLDGTNVSLLFHEVPDQRDKEELLRETWETALTFLNDPNITDEQALEYAASTVAGGILFTHPFADGNGRTSRAFSYLIELGPADSEEIKDMLTKSVSESWNVTPRQKAMLPFQHKFTGEQPERLIWEDQMAGEAEDAMDGLVVDSVYQNIMLRSFLEMKGDAARDIIDRCSVRSQDGTLVSVDGDALITALVNDPEHGFEYASDLHDLRRLARSDYVRRFLDTMSSNEPRVMQVAEQKQLRPSESASVFVKDVAEVLKMKLAKRQIDPGSILPRDDFVIAHKAYSTIYHGRLLHSREFNQAAA